MNKTNRNQLIAKLLPLAILCFAVSQTAQPTSSKHAPKTWSPAVKAIVQTKCLGCHNDARHPEAVNLSTFDKMMKSGEHGKMVVWGHPELSKLYTYVDGEKQPRMPFNNPPLTPKEIATIKTWIKTSH